MELKTSLFCIFCRLSNGAYVRLIWASFFLPETFDNEATSNDKVRYFSYFTVSRTTLFIRKNQPTRCIMADEEALKKARSLCKSKFTRLSNSISDNAETMSRSLLEGKFAELKAVWSELQEAHDEYARHNHKQYPR